MTRIMIDHDTQAKLLGLAQPMEVCDVSGKVLGRFLPALDPSLYEDLEPKISREELIRRMSAKGKSYTTEEILTHLESL